MANVLNKNPIHIDTFSAAIDLSDYLPGQETHLSSIEWARPVTQNDKCVIFSGGATGVTLFDEVCIVASQSIIKYFHGAPIGHLYLPATSGVTNKSGVVIITRAR